MSDYLTLRKRLRWPRSQRRPATKLVQKGSKMKEVFITIPDLNSDQEVMNLVKARGGSLSEHEITLKGRVIIRAWVSDTLESELNQLEGISVEEIKAYKVSGW